MGLLGSVPIEQNHSVNVRHMISGETWSITEEIVELMKKHQHYWRQQTQMESNLKVSIHRYKTNEEGRDGIDDTLAKQHLTQNAYTNFICKVIKVKTVLTIHN